MAYVVVVHGIAQQFDGGITLHERYIAALLQGVTFAGGTVDAADVEFADYGVLFRPEAEYLGTEPYHDANALTDELELELLQAWWLSAADAGLVPPADAEVLARYPSWAKTALVALCNTPYMSGVTESALIGNLKQVRDYFREPGLRQEARRRVAASIGPETKVVVGHSLGSVVAYEVLCALQRPPDLALVTLGSPLGLPRVIFDRLDPPPTSAVKADAGPRGSWPRPVRAWTNVCDESDIVAAAPDLRPLFGRAITQVTVHNGSHAHDMSRYLTDKATGNAIASALAE